MQPLSAQIKRLWAVRLTEEHRVLCRQHDLELEKPLFEIIPSSRVWGRYRSLDNTIQISEQLIEGYSWDVVLQVLKHEMAHQMVAAQDRLADGHGRLFRQAAERLGLDPRFAAASGDLPRTMQEDLRPESGSGRLHRRVAKLLQLASSDNPHEAKLALEKAGLLISRYNLRFLSDSVETTYGYRIISLGRKRISAAQRLICSLLCRHFFVEVVLSSLYDANLLAVHRTVELLGKIENIETAEYVFHFLEDRLQHLWEIHRRKTGCRVGMKKAYLLGILGGFAEQLDQRFASADKRIRQSGQTAIIVSPLKHDTVLQNVVRRRHPQLRMSRMASCRLDADTFAAGKRQGKSLSFYRPLSEKTAAAQGIRRISGGGK